MGKKSKLTKLPAYRTEKLSKGKIAPLVRGSLGIEFAWMLPALLFGFLIYLNTLGGEFVYDDLRQIVRNILIQDGSKIWQALSSDVWAFKGGDEASSNYWRPSFVLWMILNFRCFGLNVVGWHLTSVLLHVGVIALAFAFLRRLGVSRPIAGAIALIFAVHPVHTESVAWISGAPDLILGAAVIGSIWFVDLLAEKQTPARWICALALYAVALGAKEIAILYPALVAVLVSTKIIRRDKGSAWQKTIQITWPFVAGAGIYLIVRFSILGIIERLPGAGATLSEAILTVPAVFTFYLRQMIIPIWIGPSYPLRAVNLTNIGLGNFLIPLLITIGAISWMMGMAKRSGIARIGLVLFLFPLLPAMNIMAFHPEQLIHDRYLYVPLLGFLILVIPALVLLLENVASARLTNPALLVFIFASIAAIPLGGQTFRYNRAWTSNIALWEWAVRSDPTSGINFEQYGVQLQRDKRRDEAVTALNKSIAIKPMATAYVARATTLIDQNQFEAARGDLRAVTARDVSQVTPYTMYQAYERLAILSQQEHKPNEAVDSLMEGRRRLPQYQAALTQILAVILYQIGEKRRAIEELNNVRDQARKESLAESRLVLYRLGLLNKEMGQSEEARKAFDEFLSLTENIATPEIKQARAQSETALSGLDK